MNILVLGSGGREHAIIKKISESSSAGKIFCIPGNAGTSELSQNVSLDISDHKTVIDFVKKNGIGLTVVGPEDPLTAGIVNSFEKEGLMIFGPTKEAAEIEASKAFSKDLMRKYNIPTADYRTFTDHKQASDHIKSKKHPIVVKASGLAAGKGAVVSASVEESLKTLDQMMISRTFGSAGDKVVIEEFMTGEEASIFAICDGTNYKVLAPAQDHKAAYDGDKGPNTGGMGSYAPAPVITSKMMNEISARIIAPTLKAMKAEGRTFKGVLFAGLMITDEGPKVIEFNCRFGDPETQVILPLFDGDLLDLIIRSVKGELNKNEILPQKNAHCLSLVLASGGYPGKYSKGYEITGLDQIGGNTSVIHAGTVVKDGKIITSGGRVLNIVSTALSLSEAKKYSYQAASKIEFKDKFFRSDIGDKGILRYKC